MGNRITIVGSGNCTINPNRAAASLLTELDDGQFFLFDCGRGVTNRLVELGLKCDELEHIIISHFHPDHVAELVPLLQAKHVLESKTDLHLYGPPGLIRFFEALKEAFKEQSLSGDFKVICREFGEGAFSVFGQEIEYVKLTHADNQGIRFSRNGKTFAYTGDALFDELEVDFLKGVDLAVIDAGHPSLEEIVELACRSQAKTVVCSHLNSDLDGDYLNENARRQGYQGRILVAQDLMSFPM